MSSSSASVYAIFIHKHNNITHYYYSIRHIGIIRSRDIDSYYSIVPDVRIVGQEKKNRDQKDLLG